MPDAVTHRVDDALVERLMRDFYLSRAYDPKAARPADNVKSAIAFALEAAGVAELREENERLRDLLDTERYKVAIGVQRVRKALDSRRWLSEPGRGSYAYDDERYQQEFGAAINEVDAALEPLRSIAGDWSDCPRDPIRVAANRAAALTNQGKAQADG